MHIPDGYLSASLAAATGVAGAAAVGYGVWRVNRELREKPHLVPLLATTAAFVFAAQMLNFPIGGGTSGHFLGAATAAALLGPWGGCLAMTVVLSIQRLLFADGGVFALGANVFNMAVIGSLGGYLAMRALRAMLPAGRAGLLASVAAASWLSVVLASAACALELALSGRSPLPVVLPAMVGTHAIIGAGEALIAAAVLAAVAGRRPDILPDWAGLAEKRDGPAPLRRRVWIPAAVGLAVALALAAFVSPFKSGAPDGLEKTIEAKKIAAAGPEPKGAWNWTPFADYSIGGVGSGKLSTALAGILGTAGVFAVGFGAIRLFLGRAGSLHSRRG